MLVASASPASAATSAKSYTQALVRQTAALPPGSVTKTQRRKLGALARHAARSAAKKPCTAVADLARYRRVLRTVKIRKGKRYARARNRVAALGPSSLKTSQKLLGDKRTKRCGGGVRPSTLADTKTTMLSSNENGFTVRVQLPVLRLVPETGGGKPWAKLVLPNTDSPGTPGTPGIPMTSSNFAVPDGATLNVVAGSVQSYKLDGIDVFPAQPDVVDQDNPPPDFTKPPFKDKPFTIDNAAYKTPGPVPAAPADGQILGTARDVAIGGLQIPAGQYDPTTKVLRVFKSIDVSVGFMGGSHSFSDELNSPWEEAQRRFLATLLNVNILRFRDLAIIRRCGEQMLVITNPATRPAADTFATARRLAGIRTSVFETGAAASQIGTTPAQIQTFIRNRLGLLGCIHPSYVTIMGDDDLVPTFPGINGIPSDLQYSMKNDVDELPDLAVGRIIGNDQGEVGAAVAKIIGYETTPLTGDSLNHALIAAQFQDDDADGRENRTFVLFGETVRNGLVARGVTVDRVYKDSPTTTPLKLNDGTDLPASLKKPTFPWNGTGADVSSGWNAGRFMVVHRDHGWSDGWSTPGFGTGDVNALTNTNDHLPVLLSINCSSGAYDYDETSFAGQALVKPTGGAVGVFGDTRDSPTWHNTQIALGFVDALLPSVLPGEGPATKQRMGDALISGKLRLAGLAPPAGDGSTRNELYLWHYFGDPTMQMWGGGVTPLVFDPGRFRAVYKQLAQTGPNPPPYGVEVTFPAELIGQPISLLRNGDVVGKGVAGNGPLTIPASFGDGSVKPGDLQIALDPDGGKPVLVPVSGVPEPPPQKTTLTANCSPNVDFNADATTSGRLEPAFAGAPIKLTYTRPDQTTFSRTAPTDANGNWTDTISTNADWPNHGGNGGTWQVQASYEGDAGHKASSAPACTFIEGGG